MWAEPPFPLQEAKLGWLWTHRRLNVRLRPQTCVSPQVKDVTDVESAFLVRSRPSPPPPPLCICAFHPSFGPIRPRDPST